MHIVEVIPITRGVGKETLSYFSAVALESGSLIKVPLRNRNVPALVLSSKPAGELKSELRQSAFVMRKISRAKAVPLFLPQYIEAAQDMADYAVSSTGNILADVTPKTILEFAEKIKNPQAESVLAAPSTTHEQSDSAAADTKPAAAPSAHSIEEKSLARTREPYTLQADEDDRLAHYKSLIREQFARKKSVFFCLPTIQDIKRISEKLPKGIEEYTFILNSALTKKELVETWNKILAEQHQVLIIATGTFLGIPRTDIGTIILERESSSGYKSQTRPYVDMRTFVEVFAKKIGAQLILGDLLLRTETLWRTKNGDLAELTSLKFRSVSSAETVIIDMKKYKSLATPEFRILSDEFEQLALSNKNNNENMFVFAARRGLSPMTVCGDCGTTVICSRCSAPVILHSSGSQQNFFMCHRCGERRSAEERCRVCTSWKLTTLGIGIELIEETIRNIFPDIKILRLDKDSVKTHKQALAVAQEFYNSPGSILLGTEMALAYLEKPIDNSAVAAIDSLFSVPDFRMNEKIMSILLRTRSITQKTCLVQTRSRDQRVFDYAAKGNLMDFYREEIDERKKLSYPPFSTLIKITIKGPRAKVGEEMKKIETRLADYKPLVFPAFIETIKKQSIMHALLKLDQGAWIIPKLQEALSALPPYVAVNVDPESLL